MPANMNQSTQRARSPDDSGEYMAVRPEFKRLGWVLQVAPAKPKVVPYASTLPRDKWSQPKPDRVFEAGFAASVVYVLVFCAMAATGDVGLALAALGVPGIPAGFVAGAVTRSVSRAGGACARGFMVLAAIAALPLFAVVYLLGPAIAAAGWCLAMIFAIGGASVASLACFRSRRRLRAERWPHYVRTLPCVH